MSASVNRAWLKQQINLRRRERLGVPEHDPRLHGTVHTYKNLGCRCADCCAASRDAKRRWRSSKKATKIAAATELRRTPAHPLTEKGTETTRRSSPAGGGAAAATTIHNAAGRAAA